MKTLTEQLACARRELAMRKNVYPKRLATGQMKPEASEHECRCMESIIATLEKCLMLAEVSEEMKGAKREV